MELTNTITIKNGNKQYITHNLLLDEYLMNLLLGTCINYGFNFINDMDKVFIRVTRPIDVVKNGNYGAGDFDFWLTTTPSYYRNAYGVEAYNRFSSKTINMQPFNGEKITALGFGCTEYYNETEGFTDKIHSVVDVSSLEIYINASEPLEILRTDNCTYNATFIPAPTNTLVKAPCHLIGEKITTSSGSLKTEYRALIEKIGATSTLDLTELQLEEKNCNPNEFFETDKGVKARFITPVLQYVKNNEIIYASNDLYTEYNYNGLIVPLYALKGQTQYLFYKYRVYRVEHLSNVPSGEYPATFTATNDYYYMARKVVDDGTFNYNGPHYTELELERR